MLTFVLKVIKDDAGNEHTLFYRIVLKDRGFGTLRRVLAQLSPDTDVSDFRPGEADEIFQNMEIRARVRVKRGDEEYPDDSNEVRAILPAE